MLRILALGDSYTIGEGVTPEERWPAQLARRLRERRIAVEDPLIIARTGWTTDELTAAIAEARPPGPFDLVTLLIGVNNQYRGRDLEEYRAEFRDLLRQAIAFAGEQPGRVLVLSIPDWSVTTFAEESERWSPLRAKVAGEIEAFNRVNWEESEGAGARYVDMTQVSREKRDSPGWLAADRLHPSGKMYAVWVKVALPVVLEMTDEGDG